MHSVKQGKMIAGGFYLGVAVIVSIVSGYALNVWLARELTPAPYGRYCVVIALMSALNIMQTAGLPLAVSKRVSESPQHAGAILRLGLSLQAKLTLCLTVFMLILSYPIAHLLKDNSLAPYIACSGLIFPTAAIYTLFVGYYNGLHDFRLQARINIVYSVSKFILVVILIYPFGLYGAIIGFVIAPLVALIGVPGLPKADNGFPLKSLMNESLKMIGFSAFTNLILCIDIFLLKSLHPSDHDVGYYAAAQNIARVPYSVIGAFAYTLFPAISRHLACGDHEGAHRLLNENVKLIVFLLVPLTLLLAVSAPQITGILYGEAYIPGAGSLSILSIGGGMLTIFNIFAFVLNGAGKAKASMLFAAIGLAVSVIACSILIPSMGMIGAASGICIGALFAVGAALFYLNRIFVGFFPLMSLIYSVTISFLLILPMIEYKPTGIALLLSSLLLFSAYIVLLAVFKQVKWPIKVRA